MIITIVKKKQPIADYHEIEELRADVQLEDFVVNKIHTKELVAKLLAELTQRERDIIILRYYVELSYREIAEVMNLSKSNVGFILHETKKKLRGIVSL